MSRFKRLVDEQEMDVTRLYESLTERERQRLAILIREFFDRVIEEEIDETLRNQRQLP